MIERIYIYIYIYFVLFIIKSEVWTITHCLGLGQEIIVCDKFDYQSETPSRLGIHSKLARVIEQMVAPFVGHILLYLNACFDKSNLSIEEFILIIR